MPPFEEGRSNCFAAVRLLVSCSVDQSVKQFPFIFFAEVAGTERKLFFFFMILNISIYKKTDIYSHTHISTLMNNYLNVFFNALWLLAYIEKK